MSSKYSKKALRDRLVTSLAGGVKGKPHASKEGIEAAAGRTFSRIVQAGGLRSKTSGPKVFGAVKRKPKNKKLRNF